jgi:solute carrier family 9B (sodium/hydrogen exchanger), member 1/2
VVGLATRVTAAFFISVEKRYTWKEKLFMAMTWIPKATVQAVLGSVLLNDAKKYKLPEYVIYG